MKEAEKLGGLEKLVNANGNEVKFKDMVDGNGALGQGTGARYNQGLGIFQKPRSYMRWGSLLHWGVYLNPRSFYGSKSCTIK